MPQSASPCPRDDRSTRTYRARTSQQPALRDLEQSRRRPVTGRTRYRRPPSCCGGSSGRRASQPAARKHRRRRMPCSIARSTRCRSAGKRPAARSPRSGRSTARNDRARAPNSKRRSSAGGPDRRNQQCGWREKQSLRLHPAYASHSHAYTYCPMFVPNSSNAIYIAT